jgi:hypothetical protein
MMAISSAETQLFSLDKALRCEYPYFGIFTGISAPYMANLGLLGLDVVLFVGGFIVYNANYYDLSSFTSINDGYRLGLDNGIYFDGLIDD